MTSMRIFVVVCLAVAVSGCGSPMAGNYAAHARMMDGRVDEGTPGYSLAEIQAKLAAQRKTIELHGNGTFVWHTGDAVIEGTWRTENGTMYIRDTVYNGTKIQGALQKDRDWRIGSAGELITGTYTAYGIEEYYQRTAD